MLAANGSILTILAISFERYYAICQPLKAGYKCTRIRALIIICIVWIVSCALTLPVLSMASSSTLEYFDGSTVQNCILETSESWQRVYVFGSLFAFFCLPLLVLTVVYWLIARRLVRETLALTATNYDAASSDKLATNGKSAATPVPELESGSATNEARKLSDKSLSFDAGLVGSQQAALDSSTSTATATPTGEDDDYNNRPPSVDRRQARAQFFRRAALARRKWRSEGAPSVERHLAREQQNCSLIVRAGKGKLASNNTLNSAYCVVSRAMSARDAAAQKLRTDARRQVVVMLAFVVGAFFLLFAPYRLLTVWLLVSSEDQVRSLGMEAYYNISYVSRILIYLHSAINPIAYNMISTKFRAAFCAILFFRAHRKKRRQASCQQAALLAKRRSAMQDSFCAGSRALFDCKAPPTHSSLNSDKRAVDSCATDYEFTGDDDDDDFNDDDDYEDDDLHDVEARTFCEHATNASPLRCCDQRAKLTRNVTVNSSCENVATSSQSACNSSAKSSDFSTQMLIEKRHKTGESSPIRVLQRKDPSMDDDSLLCGLDAQSGASYGASFAFRPQKQSCNQ